MLDELEAWIEAGFFEREAWVLKQREGEKSLGKEAGAGETPRHAAGRMRFEAGGAGTAVPKPVLEGSHGLPDTCRLGRFLTAPG